MKTITTLFILSLSLMTASKKTLLQQHWKMTDIEEFEEKWPVGSKRKNDRLDLNADGSFVFVNKNDTMTGNYSINSSGSLVTLKKSDGNYLFHVQSVTETNLKVKWKQPSLITSILYFKKE